MISDEIVHEARERGVRLIRFLYCDNGCTIRGKLAHIDHLVSRLESGIGLTVAMQAMNMLDQLQPVEGMGPVGEIRLVPDPDSFVVLPCPPQRGDDVRYAGFESPAVGRLPTQFSQAYDRPCRLTGLIHPGCLRKRIQPALPR